jgi:hypothetical protein
MIAALNLEPIASRPSCESTKLSGASLVCMRRSIAYAGDRNAERQRRDSPPEECDHEEVKKLFKEIEAEEDPEAIFDQIKGALEVHATIEEGCTPFSGLSR